MGLRPGCRTEGPLAVGSLRAAHRRRISQHVGANHPIRGRGAVAVLLCELQDRHRFFRNHNKVGQAVGIEIARCPGWWGHVDSRTAMHVRRARRAPIGARIVSVKRARMAHRMATEIPTYRITIYDRNAGPRISRPRQTPEKFIDRHAVAD